MSGRLTTHVLDLSRGIPAAGMKLELRRLSGAENWELLRNGVTNGDGRLDAPLLEGAKLVPGSYELLFHVGEYFRAGAVEADPSEVLFLDQIPIRFQVADCAAHYHVPLLVAPGGYSTYRGS